MIRPLPSPFNDLAQLLARVVLAAVLIAHGWQKFVTNGLGQTAGSFEKMGIPLPPASATFTAVVELFGGTLLLLGAATTLVALLVVLIMLGAGVMVHIGNGVFVSEGGWELVGVIAAAALLLAASGAGRFSVDHALRTRRAHSAA
jgi:putative oxidoreductase